MWRQKRFRNSLRIVRVIGATAWPVGQSKAEKAGGPSGKTEEEIQELHNNLIQAQLNSDIAALDRIWADDHILRRHLGAMDLPIYRSRSTSALLYATPFSSVPMIGLPVAAYSFPS